MTHELIFDVREDDVYWCTADVGWVTGHSYIVYGPLANGATTLMFEGVPNYPDAGRFWQTVDKHKVTIFYTAPTAIRALMREGDAPVKGWSRTLAATARLGRRADQSGSVGVVSPRRRRRPLPGRRHLVADGDRRHPDQPAARRDRSEARLGDAAVLRREAGDRRRRRQDARRRVRGQSRDHRQLARPDAHGVRRSPALHRHVLQDLPRPLLHRRRREARRRRLLLDHGTRRRRAERRRPSSRHGGNRERAGRASESRRSRGRSAIRTTSRARASTPTSR